MTEPVTAENRGLFLAACKGAYGCRIAALYATLRHPDTPRFWLIREGDFFGAAALSGTELILSCGADAPWDELWTLIRYSGCKTVFGPTDLLRRLFPRSRIPALIACLRGGISPYSYEEAPLLRLKEEKLPLLPGTQPPITADPDSGAVYRLLTTAFEDLFPEDETAYVYSTFYRKKSGTCRLYAILEDGRPVSTLSAAYITRRDVIFGGIATAQNARGRGLASSLILRVAKPYLREGKRVWLFAANEALCDFYLPLGFVRAGRFGRAFVR